MFHFRRHKEDSKDSEATDKSSQQQQQQQQQQQHSSEQQQQAGSYSTTGNQASHDPRGYHVTSDPLFKASGQNEHGQHATSSDPNTRGAYIPHSDSHTSTGGGYGSHESSSRYSQGQSAADSMRQTASHASDKTSSAASSATATMTQTAKQATGAIKDMLPDQLENGLRRSAEQTSAYLQSLKDVIADHDRHNGSSSVNSSSMHKDISQAETSVDKMKRLSEEFRAKGNNVSDAMMAEARKSVDDMMKTLNDLAGRAKEYEGLNESTSSTSSTGPSTTQMAKEKIVGIMYAARETAQNGFEALKHQLSSAQQSVSSTAASAKDKVVDTAMSAKDTTVEKSSQAVDATKAKSSEMAQGAQEQGAGIKQKAAQVLNQSLDYVADTLHAMKVETNTTDSAKDQAQSATENVKDKASSMATDAKDKVGSMATDIKEKTQAATSDLKHKSSHDESSSQHTPLSRAP